MSDVDSFIKRAPNSLWFLQAQFDFGLGSILGDNDKVTDVWNPFLHFQNAE